MNERAIKLLGDQDRQTDLFLTTPSTPRVVVDWARKKPVFIVSCGKSKKSFATKADELYTSARFRHALGLAQALGSRYFILSAKHGLLMPNEVIAPYDVELRMLDTLTRSNWASEVVSRLSIDATGQTVVFLAAESYTNELALQSDFDHHFNFEAPLAGKDEAAAQNWLKTAAAAAPRVRDLAAFYGQIAIRRSEGAVFSFSRLPETLPAQGVYIFLDPAEANAFDGGPRIVRVGTHAVSLGSAATLRSRLRAHIGLASGGGNHRSSIFRLHIGRALLASEGNLFEMPSWGVGQSPNKHVQALEETLERRVTSYIKGLEVFILPISDRSSSRSDRAFAEAQLIALLSQSFDLLDRPSPTWLGCCSPHETISKSGLWNVRGVAKQYQPAGKGCVSNLIGLGKKDVGFSRCDKATRISSALSVSSSPKAK